MKNSQEMQTLLAQIRAGYQPDLVANEPAILEEIESNDELKTGIGLKILSIVGGILASVAFIGFLAIAGLFESEISIVVFGFICLVASLFMVANADKLVFSTITASFYIIGYVLIGAGFMFQNVVDSTICVVFIALGSVALFVTGNWIFAFISVLLINGSFISLVLISNYQDLIHLYLSLALMMFLWVSLNEPLFITGGKKMSRLYEPLRLGMLLSVIGGLAFVGIRGMIPLNYNLRVISSIVSVGCMIFLATKVFNVIQVQKSSAKLMILVCGFITMLPTLMAPAIPGSLLIILVCFYVNYKPGLVLGIVALIFFISRFYYDLQLTLLTKSLLLMISGLIFLGCYFITHKKLDEHE